MECMQLAQDVKQLNLPELAHTLSTRHSPGGIPMTRTKGLSSYSLREWERVEPAVLWVYLWQSLHLNQLGAKQSTPTIFRNSLTF